MADTSESPTCWTPPEAFLLDKSQLPWRRIEAGGTCSPPQGRECCGYISGYPNAARFHCPIAPVILTGNFVSNGWSLQCVGSIPQGQAVQDSGRSMPCSTPAPLMSLPASGWSLVPTAWLIKNKLPWIWKCCWKIPVEEPGSSQSQKSRAC